MLNLGLDMDLVTWVGAAVGCALVVLLAVIMLGRRVDRLTEHLIDLRQLQKYMQQIEQEQARVVAALGAVAQAVPDLRLLKSQLEDVNRQHALLSGRMEAMTRALEEVRATAGSMEDIRRGQLESMRALASMAGLVQRWCSGLTSAAAELERNASPSPKVVSIDASAAPSPGAARSAGSSHP